MEANCASIAGPQQGTAIADQLELLSSDTRTAQVFLKDFAEVQEIVSRHKEAHLLIGFGSSLQYNNYEDVLSDMESTLLDIKERTGEEGWLLVYGGDAPSEEKPCVGLLAQRVKAKYGCRVLAPSLKLGDEHQPPTFVDYVYQMDPDYEEQFQHPGLAAAAAAAENCTASGDEAGDTAAVASAALGPVNKNAAEGNGANVHICGNEATGSNGATDEAGATVGADTVVIGGDGGDAFVHGGDGGASADGDGDGGDGSVAVSVLGKRDTAALRADGIEDEARRTPQRQRHEYEEGNVEGNAAAEGVAVQLVMSPSTGLTTPPGARGSEEGGGGGASCGTPGGSSASGAASGDGKKTIIWGGYRGNPPRPVGASKLYLDDRMLDGSRSSLTSVIVAGGGQISKQDLEYAAKRGLPVHYIRSRALNVGTPGEYGDVDHSEWVRQ